MSLAKNLSIAGEWAQGMTEPIIRITIYLWGVRLDIKYTGRQAGRDGGSDEDELLL